MNYSIKNMVCARCMMAVSQLLANMGIEPLKVSLGDVELRHPLSAGQTAEFSGKLRDLGFELLDSRKHKQIEKIKNALIGLIQDGEIEEHFSLSAFIGTLLHREYSQVSRLFSEVEGITMEQFFILQKIEKVKEWLVYDEFTLSEIAWKLGYSSVAHLSAQFKRVTGLTPSAFRKMGGHRKPLDHI
jgi:AraC-like DNA-binding protein